MAERAKGGFDLVVTRNPTAIGLVESLQFLGRGSIDAGAARFDLAPDLIAEAKAGASRAE